MHRNSNSFCFCVFSFSSLFAAVIGLLLDLLRVKKNFEEIAIETGKFDHGVARCSGKKFCSEFFTQLCEHFLHISGSIRPITLIWASLKRSFPPAEVEYRGCQFWSKVMTLEVEERPRFVTDGYGQHRSQWVNTDTKGVDLSVLITGVAVL